MKVCMAVFVFGSYTRYIPYYVYSILKSYPDYYVKLFVRDRLTANERLCLDMIGKRVSPNFEVKEGYFAHLKFSRTEKITMVGGIETTFRHLLPHEEFKEFEFVYIGDVDFLIIKENPGLAEVHARHCELIGLPFSNAVRPDSRRLTGLHFIKVKEYYDKMEPIIQDYLNNPDSLYAEAKHLGTDEHILYNMIEKGVGFGAINEHFFRPPHGFHIGVARKGDLAEKTRKYERYINQKQLTKHGIKEQLEAYFRDPLFEEMMKLSPDKEVTFIYNKLLNR